MPQETSLAGFGTTDVKKIIPPMQKGQDDSGSRYKAFVDAIYHVVHPTSEKQIDQQTDLQWENIVGEVMLEVLKADLITGVPFLQINHPFVKFATPQECLDKLFTDKLVKKLEKEHLLPGMAIFKQKLNELLVSHKRMGRGELIQMFQAFNVSMQEHEHTEALSRRLGGRLP